MKPADTTQPKKAAPKNASYWDARFNEAGFAYGEAPNEFLRTASENISAGDALSLCEGEGRNAVYLALRGFRVTAVDFSPVGLAKAQALATRHGVTITTVLADLADFDLGEQRWDLVISIFSQPASATRQRLYRSLQQGLRPGGAFILEAKLEAQASANDRYPGAAILTQEIAPLTIALAQEQSHELNEGRYHVGLHDTVQILAFRHQPL
jgi:SAM-dependent methyltransferase